ncbi:MAG: pantetheine-phosphate adenylyltransferase [Clostridia bacterium]|nr:pantetheine-phosphate adenylyltransferase [Clostridia bacterium]
MKTCVFAGTFDPFTVGHADVVDKCKKIFDKVIIAIGVNGEKKPFFSLEERKAVLETIYEGDSQIEIVSFSGLLVDFMKSRSLSVYVRGVRNADDYKYETLTCCYNEDFYKELITLYIPTPKKYEHVSSTSVREVIKMGANFERYIPEKAIKLTKEFLAKRK